MKTTIGICSYNNYEKLQETIRSIRNNATSEYQLIVVDNASTDVNVTTYLQNLQDIYDDVKVIFNKTNLRYPGAVNQIFNEAKTEYVIYCDNDISFKTIGFDSIFINYLINNSELGWISSGSNSGAAPIDRKKYVEVMWAVGCCFAMKKSYFIEIGGMEEDLLHQNECSLCLRIRMDGKKVAVAREVALIHHCSATSSPEQQETINKGVQQFLNKWNLYFGGKEFNYFSHWVLRWDDFPPNRKYLTEYFAELKLNENPESLIFKGQKYDLIKIPMYPGYYRR